MSRDTRPYNLDLTAAENTHYHAITRPHLFRRIVDRLRASYRAWEDEWDRVNGQGR